MLAQVEAEWNKNNSSSSYNSRQLLFWKEQFHLLERALMSFWAVEFSSQSHGLAGANCTPRFQRWICALGLRNECVTGP